MKFTITLLLLIVSEFCFSQIDDHHKNEFGMANSPVLFLQSKEITYGIHFHYVRHIKTSKFGIGLAYERIFDDHKHNTFGVVLAYAPIESWTVSVSPGVTYEGATGDVMPSIHLETTYEFEIGHFHIGPLFEFAIDPEDNHISLGLHLGYGF